MRGDRFLLGVCMAVLSGCGASSLLGDPRDGAEQDAVDAQPGSSDGSADVVATDDAAVDSGPPRCGALFERCCATTCTEANTWCNPTDNRCGPCGGPGQRCCGSTCVAGACTAGVCSRPSCVGSTDRACSVIEVPGGTFTVAETIAGQQQPNITVGAFAIDATEVTVRRFRRYFPSVSQPPPRPPATVRYPGGVFAIERQVFSPSDPVWMSPPGAAEDHPITAVWFNAAQAFCVAEGGRLPTEAEFEWVAYGMVSDGRPRPRAFAWGPAAPSSTCDRAHWNNCPGDDGQRTRRVASFAATGAFFDLTGNVEEYTADELVPFGDPRCWGGVARVNPLCVTGAAPGARSFAVRGGELGNTNPAPLVPDASRRSAGGENTSTLSRGFRCVYDR